MTEELDEHSILSLPELLGLLDGPGGERSFSDIERSVVELLPDTPHSFHHIVQYAAVWGIGDDCCRTDFVDSASLPLLRNLKWVFEQHEEALEEWLAGPEADNLKPTKAYVAFTCLVMAADAVGPHLEGWGPPAATLH